MSATNPPRHPLARRHGRWPALATLALGIAAVLAWRPGQAGVPALDEGVSVLMYHHVGDWGAPGDWSPWVVKPADFEAQLDWLLEHGYHPITLAQFQAHRERGEALPPQPFLVKIGRAHV